VPRDFGRFPARALNPNGGAPRSAFLRRHGARIISMASGTGRLPKGNRAIVSICADGGLGSVLLLEAGVTAITLPGGVTQTLARSSRHTLADIPTGEAEASAPC